MHPYLIWNIAPPLWCSIIIGCLCLLSTIFLVFLIHLLIRVYYILVLHSNVSVVSILDYPQWLLLLLFIKSDHISNCGVSWLIIKEFKKSLTFWIFPKLPSDQLCTICQQLSSVDLILYCQSITKLFLVEPYSSNICYHQPLWNCWVIQTSNKSSSLYTECCCNPKLGLLT